LHAMAPSPLLDDDGGPSAFSSQRDSGGSGRRASLGDLMFKPGDTSAVIFGGTTHFQTLPATATAFNRTLFESRQARRRLQGRTFLREFNRKLLLIAYRDLRNLDQAFQSFPFATPCEAVDAVIARVFDEGIGPVLRAMTHDDDWFVPFLQRAKVVLAGRQDAEQEEVGGGRGSLLQSLKGDGNVLQNFEASGRGSRNTRRAAGEESKLFLHYEWALDLRNIREAAADAMESKGGTRVPGVEEAVGEIVRGFHAMFRAIEDWEAQFLESLVQVWAEKQNKSPEKAPLLGVCLFLELDSWAAAHRLRTVDAATFYVSVLEMDAMCSRYAVAEDSYWTMQNAEEGFSWWVNQGLICVAPTVILAERLAEAAQVNRQQLTEVLLALFGIAISKRTFFSTLVASMLPGGTLDLTTDFAETKEALESFIEDYAGLIGGQIPSAVDHSATLRCWHLKIKAFHEILEDLEGSDRVPGPYTSAEEMLAPWRSDWNDASIDTKALEQATDGMPKSPQRRFSMLPGLPVQLADDEKVSLIIKFVQGLEQGSTLAAHFLHKPLSLGKLLSKGYATLGSHPACDVVVDEVGVDPFQAILVHMNKQECRVGILPLGDPLRDSPTMVVCPKFQHLQIRDGTRIQASGWRFECRISREDPLEGKGGPRSRMVLLGEDGTVYRVPREGCHVGAGHRSHQTQFEPAFPQPKWSLGARLEGISQVHFAIHYTEVADRFTIVDHSTELFSTKITPSPMHVMPLSPGLRVEIGPTAFVVIK